MGLTRLNPERIDARFKKYQEEHEIEKAKFIANLPSFLPSEHCSECGSENQIDRDLSMKNFEPAYPCRHCKNEAIEVKIVQRLQSFNVPNRLLKASFESYESYDPDQSIMIEQIREWLNQWESSPLLYLGGTCGTGKGHMAATAIRHLLPSRARWISQAKLISQYHATEFSDKDSFQNELEEVPVLVIDEIGGRSASRDTPELFFRILDERLDKLRVTILTGNLSPSELYPVIGAQRMADRFAESGKAIRFNWESFRQRRVQ